MVVAVVRMALTLNRRRLAFWPRAGAAATGLVGMWLLFHTGEQGARLVYEHGVGVLSRAHGDAAPTTR
jgi:hypothetical protein